MPETLNRNLLFFIVVSVLLSCNNLKQDKGPLPILGFKDQKVEGADTVNVYHTIPDFSFVDQKGDTITRRTYDGKVYVADFFFTSCPTICPKMKAQMIRLHDALADEHEVLLLSHTIDPAHDSVAVLNDYAERLGINPEKWHMVTGKKSEIYEIAESYLTAAAEDPNAPGGFIHSGAFMLIDRLGRIRGAYDGTKPETVKPLLSDIRKLLNEEQ